MDIVVNEELKAYIDPLTPEEYESLERSILTEGCRDALVLWGDVLVDGHNRHGICQKHGLPFQTVQNTRFQSIEDVHLWMIDQHLGRRSVSDFQRGVLALRKREIVAAKRAAVAAASADGAASQDGATDAPAASANDHATPAPLDTREAIARAARLKSSQVVAIEKIHQQATPELVAAVKSGTISINAAAAVASLPAEEQVAAAAAGKDELKQAAKRVRDSKKKPRAESSDDAPSQGKSADGGEGDSAEVESLRQRVAALTTENTALKKQVANLLDQLMARSGSNAEAELPAPF
ncbi:plasmid replication/partition related protein [Variovorax sp. J22R133]|uniref:plasmid replication/partition related protein n=1 Tax=Variovorax brevis TaxID=3053503 RepID=UPI002577D817|nr:plasmid replication/partition related protein [Variovorax sp. J22R133]MDM0111029.1 plasmid replication/partition related protein [Variovorax sp. J22R133]